MTNSLPTKRFNINDAEASKEHPHILLQKTHYIQETAFT